MEDAEVAQCCGLKVRRLLTLRFRARDMTNTSCAAIRAAQAENNRSIDESAPAPGIGHGFSVSARSKLQSGPSLVLWYGGSSHFEYCRGSFYGKQTQMEVWTDVKS